MVAHEVHDCQSFLVLPRLLPIEPVLATKLNPPITRERILPLTPSCQPAPGYGFDWVFVLKVHPAEKKGKKWIDYGRNKDKYSHQKLLQKLSQAGFQTRMFFSLQHDEVSQRLYGDHIPVMCSLTVSLRCATGICQSTITNGRDGKVCR